jgi:hypothetical protein
MGAEAGVRRDQAQGEVLAGREVDGIGIMTRPVF